MIPFQYNSFAKKTLYENSFCYLGYVADTLDDAKVYSNHASKKNIDGDDVKLAVQCRMDNAFTSPPPRDVIIRPIVKNLCFISATCSKSILEKQLTLNRPFAIL